MMDLKSAANVDNPDALSNQMRNRRFSLFLQLIEDLPRPIRIIDIGGTQEFWEKRGWAGRQEYQITAVNLAPRQQEHENIRVVNGDATNLAGIDDQTYDVAFSNSVIEHLFTLENQLKMGAEIQRVAKAYWVQTPNFWFPIEPHFHVPGWQWLPRKLRISLIQRRQCGWRGPCPDIDEARSIVDEVRLMSCSELRRAFPGANVWHERFYGLTKSLVAYDGFSKTL